MTNFNFKRLLLPYFIFILSVVSNGQINHVSPCYDFSDQIPQIKEYNQNLENVLISNFNEEYLIRFIARPSFDPEYAFQICQAEDSAFIIEAFEMKANLWNNKRPDSIDSFKREIDITLKGELIALFSHIIDSQTKYLIRSQEDGEQYNFMANTSEGLKCAQAESADVNSALYEVIEIMDELMRYARDKDKGAASIRKKIKSLCMRIGC